MPALSGGRPAIVTAEHNVVPPGQAAEQIAQAPPGCTMKSSARARAPAAMQSRGAGSALDRAARSARRDGSRTAGRGRSLGSVELIGKPGQSVSVQDASCRGMRSAPRSCAR